LGLAADANIIRIGSGQTNTFIAGVINGNGGGLTNLNAVQLTGTAANFSAGTMSVSSNLYLPATTASSGIIYSGSGTLIHSFGSANFFAGTGAGNLSLSGANNVGIGPAALQSNTSGGYNVAVGGDALQYNTTGSQNAAAGSGALQNNTSGYDNNAIGYQTLQQNTTGYYNVADGILALQDNTTGVKNVAMGYVALANNNGSDNTAIGSYTMYGNSTGGENTAVGQAALNGNRTGNDNTAAGYGALSISTGSQNNAFGVQSLGNLQPGANNIALGYQAGVNLTNGNNNIYIGNAGITNESGIIRIGDPDIQTATYLAGTVYANGVALTSDRNAKANFAAISAAAILDKVAALPITEWNYKTDNRAVQHIGPMAQDFQAAFRLSADDKHISVVDEGGVALAAIQGLNQKLNEKDAEIQKLQSQNDSLANRLNDLEQMVQSLVHKK
jgi:hypothetical protein